MFILLIFYGSAYVALDWHGETIKAYLQLNRIFKQKPAILIESQGGGCIWKNIVCEPYIKQFCLTDTMESPGSPGIPELHMSIAIKLFAGYGNINITKKAYDKRVVELLALPGVSYDPYARCLYIRGVNSGASAGVTTVASTDDRIIAMFELASEAVQKTEAFAITPWHTLSPRDNLRGYYHRYF